MAEYLDLADYLLIAEAVLGVPAEAIARWPGIGLAESCTLRRPLRMARRLTADDRDQHRRDDHHNPARP